MLHHENEKNCTARLKHSSIVLTIMTKVKLGKVFIARVASPPENANLLFSVFNLCILVSLSAVHCVGLGMQFSKF